MHCRVHLHTMWVSTCTSSHFMWQRWKLGEWLLQHLCGNVMSFVPRLFNNIVQWQCCQKDWMAVCMTLASWSLLTHSLLHLMPNLVSQTCLAASSFSNHTSKAHSTNFFTDTTKIRNGHCCSFKMMKSCNFQTLQHCCSVQQQWHSNKKLFSPLIQSMSDPNVSVIWAWQKSKAKSGTEQRWDQVCVPLMAIHCRMLNVSLSFHRGPEPSAS